MKEKNIFDILKECITGLICMLPFMINQKIEYVHIKWLMVVVAVLFSLGLPLAVIKMMSILYQILSKKLEKKMEDDEILYKTFYALFIVLGIVICYATSVLIQNSYIWVEVIAYIIFSIWFMTDANTIECSRIIKRQTKKLQDALDVHKHCVTEYKRNLDELMNKHENMYRINDSLKSFWNDPLKVLKKEIIDIDNYEKNIPKYKNTQYVGLSKLIFGRMDVIVFRWKVQHFLYGLDTEQKWMKDEVQKYEEIIKDIEKRIEVTASGEYRNKNIGDKMGENEINRKIKDFMKINKQHAKEKNKFYRKI